MKGHGWCACGLCELRRKHPEWEPEDQALRHLHRVMGWYAHA